MNRIVLLALPRVLTLFLLAALTIATQAADPRDYAVEVSASVQTAPAQITLKWRADANATGYSVYRKAPADKSWTLLASLGGGVASWSDVSVSTGVGYEYGITKSTSAGYSGTGYLLAGINTVPVENRGKVVLIVDNTYSSALASELARLQQDLTGDGWMVLRHDVSRGDSVVSVKNLIKADYNADPSNVKAVFLFGHVPVPYSGNLYPPPDGHPDHQGAWPADAYYGDMDGVWTDNNVSNTSGNRAANQNVPGDGKFDQSDLPSDVDLQVGRVDLSNMTCYANKTPARSELDLLRAYLNKNHNFRVGQISVPRRGLIRDSFGDIYGENFASSGWRNSSSFFGAENSFAVPSGSFFSTLKDNGYLWAYGAGGGSYVTCDGVGSSDDFATTDIKAVFTGFLGSYFGDWDNESAFLRAPLGSGSCLAAVWAGRPHWFLHHMALGETIGYSAKVSQNNVGGGLYGTQNWGTYRVHVALMGDPTLRLHPVLPPVNPSASAAAGVTVNWTASLDSNIHGYVVYRANSLNGPFTKVSGNELLTSLGFTDASGTVGNIYMIRAMKLEQSGGGTYYNPSVGVFATASAPVVPVPASPSNLVGNVSGSQVQLGWVDNASNESGYSLWRKVGSAGSYTKIALAANSSAYTDSGLSEGTQYFYKVSAWNATGESTPSPEISVSTPSPVSTQPAFLGFDNTTVGNWKGEYGNEGFNLAGDKALYSAPVTVLPSGRQWIWNASPTDPAAVQRASDNTRVSACWYSSFPFDISFSFPTPGSHKVSLYMMDWDNAGREQAVELLGSDKNVIVSKSVANFQKGVYVSFKVSGSVTVRVRPVKGVNAVVSGIFVDQLLSQSTAQTAIPRINPGSGTITAGQTVTLSSTTAGATIRYTLDGSTPTSASSVYTAPFSMTKSGTVSARAFAAGYDDSGVAIATYTLQNNSAKAFFLGTDSSRQGNWKGMIGLEGYSIPGDEQSLPTTMAIYPLYQLDWVWESNSADARALQRTTGIGRHASCSYGNTFQYEVDLRDGNTHNVALYCLDWENAGRAQKVEILDYATSAVLHSYPLSSFGKGIYLNYALKGHVIIQITCTAGVNAVLSGVFVDPATTQL